MKRFFDMSQIQKPKLGQIILQWQAHIICFPLKNLSERIGSNNAGNTGAQILFQIENEPVPAGVWIKMSQMHSPYRRALTTQWDRGTVAVS